MAEDFTLAATECLSRGLSGYDCTQEEKAVWEATTARPASVSPRGSSFIDALVAQNAAEIDNMRAANQGIAKLFGSAFDFIRSSFSQYLESEGRKARECSENPAFCSAMKKYD